MEREGREVGLLLLLPHMRAIGSNSSVGRLVVMRERNKDNKVLCVQYVQLLLKSDPDHSVSAWPLILNIMSYDLKKNHKI